MLTFGRLKLRLGSWTAAAIGAVLVVTAIGVTAGSADTLYVGGCTGSRGAINCVLKVGPPADPFVRTVPAPVGEAERAEAAERDRKWLARCKPVIAPDRFGVARYRYAARGCEFGVIE